MFGRKRTKDDVARGASGQQDELASLLAVHAPLERDELPNRRPRGRAALLHPDHHPDDRPDEPERGS